MPKVWLSIYLTVAAVGITADAAGAEKVVKPGRWEITTRTVLPKELPPSVTNRCISSQDVDQFRVPESSADDDCKVVSGGLNGAVLTYVVRCARQQSETTVRFVFSGDRYEGTLEVKSENDNLRQVFLGRRLGDCADAVQPPR